MVHSKIAHSLYSDITLSVVIYLYLLHIMLPNDDTWRPYIILISYQNEICLEKEPS